MRKALAVGRKELRQILRDRRTLMILLFIPVFFLLLFGYALNFDIRHVRLAVEDRDRTPESRRLVSAFVNSGYFDLAAYVTSEQETVDLMDRSRIRAALVIPSGLSRDVQSGRPALVEVLINGDNANTAATVMAYASTIIATESARYVPATFVRNSYTPPITTVWPLSISTAVLISRLLICGTSPMPEDTKPSISSFFTAMLRNTRPSLVMVGVTLSSSSTSLNWTFGIAAAPAPCCCEIVT